MEKFTKLTAISAPLPIINVDTDMIIPKQFLKTIKRTGLGANLFDEMRFTKDGEEISDFILNNEPYTKAGIIVSGANFGCGSSREHAPWALLDFGVRCIIAPSFADIFFNNCFKNGILPLQLPQEQVDILMQHASSSDPVLTVDLEEGLASSASGIKIYFKLDEARRKCLLEGLDDIAQTLAKVTAINEFEEQDKVNRPWLYDNKE